MDLAVELQRVQADLDETSVNIKNLEAKLAALPDDAPASKTDYLQQTILALRRGEGAAAGKAASHPRYGVFYHFRRLESKCTRLLGVVDA